MANKSKHPVQRLQLALVGDTGNTMRFQIGAQSYRNGNFGYDGEFYAQENDMYIRSEGSPQIDSSDLLYVRGSSGDSDETILECSEKHWARIVGAVQEFNKAFMGTPEAVLDRTS